ncbi:6996_t:CDS:2 [Acaulospora morrowiae]|uniref:6996_t:CDS:1 n=1 Tax=Acaulospora morrowiae TaxID=94023 RepID=A0A9N9DTZ0_9GLOM|nr:6996_t:CDS:2 [Acaulospora morrowiae]
MNDLRLKLTERYRDAIFGSVNDARPVARAILTRRSLNLHKNVPKTNKTPDQFSGSGLIRFEQINKDIPQGYRTAPYVWLWIFVEVSNNQVDPILRDWQFSDYGKQRALIDPVLSLQAESWQSFEKFVASFRCVKSAVIEEDELTMISEKQKNTNLKISLQENGILIAIIIPLMSGDLNIPGTESPNEIHQYKQRQKPISRMAYKEERKKSASKNDFFHPLYVCRNCDVELPKRSGIVDGKVFRDYFNHLLVDHTSLL